MRQRLLTKLGEYAGQRTWSMLGLLILLTVIFTIMSGKLEMSMDMTSLLPGDDPMVDEFNYIFKEFNGASTIFVVVQGEPENTIAFAEHVSPMILNLEAWIDSAGSDKVKEQYARGRARSLAGKADIHDQYIERVEYKMPVEFMQRHGLMLIKPSDLKNSGPVFTDPNLLPFLTNLNDSFEKEYIQSEEKISTSQKENSAVAMLDGIETWVDEISGALYNAEYPEEAASLAAEAMTIGVPYLMSPDRSLLLIMVEPTFNIMEMDHLMPGVNGIEELVKGAAGAFNVTAGLAGGTALGRDEMVAASEDSFLLTGLALMAILILFIITFKMLSSPLMAILNLIIGIIWAMGVSYLLVDTLNMMTAMMAVVLVGLGIDFSIHIISVFSELRNKGMDANEAIVSTLQKVGPGILTGAFTTAAAFLTLMISRSDGLFEFGLVCGVGLLVIMLATFLALPTMIMLRERYRDWRGKVAPKIHDVSYQSMGRASSLFYRKWQGTMIGAILFTVVMIFFANRLEMDYNYLNMEPVGLESIRLNDLMIEKFNFSPDVTMITSKSIEENDKFTELAKSKAHISYVESITDYLPAPAEQEVRRSGVEAIKNQMSSARVQSSVSASEVGRLVDELARLEANVIELQDMAYMGGQDKIDDKSQRLVGSADDPSQVGNLSAFVSRMTDDAASIRRISRLNRDYGKVYQQAVLNMADTSPITAEMLPPLIRDKHISKDGSRYLMTLYPKGNVWDIAYLEAFTEEVLSITPAISGTPPMFYFLIEQIGEDGKRASMLTILVVFLFLWRDFKSMRYALLAMLPLLFGVVWMVGFMGLFGVKITLLNIMALPMILGIGIDDGVHLLHRYRFEGKGKIDTVYRSTGKAVIITSLTTMLAFGSLIFATYRGFGSMGMALLIGVGTCLLASLFVLPPALALIEGNKNESSKG